MSHISTEDHSEIYCYDSYKQLFKKKILCSSETTMYISICQLSNEYFHLDQLFLKDTRLNCSN